MGKIVTFYSYKGGTGRSMALANVAWVLASAGEKVLVVDWDLEAPGLHRYLRPFLSDKDLLRDDSEGLIDFMIDFTERMATAAPSEDARWYEKHADIGKWAKRLAWPSGAEAQTSLGGHIDFVPAGRQGPEYAKRVNSFDWAGFYRKYNGGAFMDAVRRNMAANYDWVLIDSRTGVSDTSGICTMQLPDVLVVCFTLNYQSIDGAVAVASSSQEGRKKGLRILPLPTRLDGNETASLNAMLAYARRVFDPLMEPYVDRQDYWRSMGVPYFSRYAYAEKLAPFEEQVSDTSSTLPSMERLTSHITETKISKLQALPEPHRTDALKEFELLPEADIETPVGSKTEISKVPLFAKRGWFWVQNNLAAVMVLMIAAFFGIYIFYRTGSSVDDQITALSAGAVKAFSNGDRKHTALLIAEAAARLDPKSVVSATIEPASQVYWTFIMLQRLSIQDKKKAKVAFSADGKWLAMTGPFPESTELFKIPPPGGDPGMAVGYDAAAFLPDTRSLVTRNRDGNTALVDVSSGRITVHFPIAVGETWGPIAVSADGTQLASLDRMPDGAGSGTNLAIVDLVSARVSRTIRDVTGARLLAFSADSRFLATGGSDQTVRWWDAQSGRLLESLGPHTQGVAAVAFDPAPFLEMATVDGSGVARIWYTPKTPVVVATDAASPLAYSPDGKWLALAKNTSGAVLCSVENGGPSRVYSLGQGEGIGPTRATAFAFSSDSKWLVTGDQDGNLFLSDLQGHTLMRRSPGAPITSVAVSPDRKFIAVATDKGVSLELVRFEGQDATYSAEQVKGMACSQATESQLSASEWKKYFGSEPLRYTCGDQH